VFYGLKVCAGIIPEEEVKPKDCLDTLYGFCFMAMESYILFHCFI